MSTEYTRRFPGIPESIAETRHWMRAVLAEVDCDEEAVETAELIISELATNAVRYSASGFPGGVYRATVAHGAGQVRLEIADQGSDSEPVVRRPREEWEAVNGRGLWMIQQMAIRLVIIGDHTGRVVFADIPAHQPTDPDADAAVLGQPVLCSSQPGAWAALIPAVEALIVDDYDLTRDLRALIEEEAALLQDRIHRR